MSRDLHTMTGIGQPALTVRDIEELPALRGLVVFASPRTRVALLMRFGVLPGGRDAESIAARIGGRPTSVYHLLRDLVSRYQRALRHDVPSGAKIPEPSLENLHQRIAEAENEAWRDQETATRVAAGLARMTDHTAP